MLTFHSRAADWVSANRSRAFNDDRTCTQDCCPQRCYPQRRYPMRSDKPERAQRASFPQIAKIGGLIVNGVRDCQDDTARYLRRRKIDDVVPQGAKASAAVYWRLDCR